LQGQTPQLFRWEAYTLGTSIKYPDFGTDHPSSLKLGNNYRVQLVASDFDLGTFNVLGLKDWSQPIHFEPGKGNDPFSIKLLNPTINNFAQGYRVTYNSLTFLSN